MKRIIATVLALILALSFSATSAFAATFYVDEDGTVNPEPTIELGLKRGIISYAPDGEYRPLDTLTRAEFAQMLYNAFADNPTKAAEGRLWWEPAADWLHEVTIRRNASVVSDATLRQLIAAYYDGDAVGFDPNASASVGFITEMTYLVFCAEAGRELDGYVPDTAYSWAIRCGLNLWSDYLNWEIKGTDDYAARFAAVALVADLINFVAD